jgi:hypothetical protein
VSHVTAGALTYLFSSQAYASDRSDWSVFGPSCRRSMPPRPVFDPDAVSRQLRARLNEWRGLLRANVGSGRRVLGKLLKGCLTFTRRVEGRREFCEFSGEGTIRPILEGIVDDSITTSGVPNGIRTRVLALKGPRPRPLDDGDA